MEILFEDESLTVVIKPPNELSEQTPDGNGFADRLAQRNPNRYVGVIHRLDRGVGGVMVYARTASAAAKLSAAVQSRTLHKEYLAIVHGSPKSSTGRMIDLLFHDRIRNKSFVVDRMRKGVKEAILDYEVIDTVEHTAYGRLSLVRIALLTGRTHQIRVQFSSRGYPLLGDGKYGASDGCPVGLFSHQIAFPHPKTGEKLTFSAKPSGGAWDLFC